MEGKRLKLVNREERGVRVLPAPLSRRPERADRRKVICLYFRPAPGVKGWDVPLREIAESCLRFSPRVALREGEAIFVEAESSGPYSPESLVLRILFLCRRFRYAPRITVAEDAPTALAMARFHVDSPRELPLEALMDYAAPFERLDPSGPESKRLGFILLSLRGLGLKTLEDFTRLEPGSLVTRFGEEGQTLGVKIREALLRPWPRFMPEQRISQVLDLRQVEDQTACADFQILLHHLELAVEQAVSRLRGRGLKAASVQVEFKLERGAPRRWPLWLPVPQGATRGILTLLRDRIRQDLDRRPIPSGVTTIRFDVLETVRSRTAQSDLFGRGSEEAEAWEGLAARLEDKLGKEKVFLAAPVERHLPEKAWKRTLEVVLRPMIQRGPLPGSRPSSRPSRLLKRPQALDRSGPLLSTAVDWSEPERIAGEWWFHPQHLPYDRSYYRVTTQGGERLWVFETADHRWFLHGYFD